VLVADTHSIGAFAAGGGSALALTDAIVRDTQADATARAGHGLVSQQGARLEARRVLVTDNHEAGAVAWDQGSVMVLTDSVVRRTRSRADGGGYGVTALAGARLEALRVLIADNHEAGAVARNADTSLALTDVVVRGTSPVPSGLLGCGLWAQEGAAVTATRVLVAESHTDGAVASGAGSTLALADSAVVATRPNTAGLFGRGLEAHTGAALTAARVLVAQNSEIGATLSRAGTTGALTDVLIVGVAPSARGFGAGATAFGGARLAVERLAVVDVHGVALAAVPLENVREGRLGDARIDGADAFVRGVGSNTIRVDPTDLDRAAGRLVAYGLHVGDGCTLDVRRAVVAQGGYGFFAAAGGSFVLRTGVVVAQLDAAGASNTTPDALVLDGVAFRGNAVDAVVHDRVLPEAAALAPPTEPSCLDARCM
jgi:hypothetical protein